MKGLRAFFVLLSVMVSAQAFAQAGISAPSEAELKSVSTQTGFCTTENKESMFFQNYCLSIKEQLEKPCSQALLKKMRDRMLSRNQPANPTPGQTRDFSYGNLYCGPAIPAVKKNEKNLELLFMQSMADLAIAESAHREYNNLEHAKMADNSSKQGGLFNLKEEWIKDEKYECGCKNDNSTGSGKDLTVNDAHLQATCATFIALYWAEKHGTFASGQKKADSKNCQPGTSADDLDGGPSGAACIFTSLQEIPRTPNDNSDPTEFKNPDLRFMSKKMDNYCKKTFDENGGSRVNTWDELNGNDWPKANK